MILDKSCSLWASGPSLYEAKWVLHRLLAWPGIQKVLAAWMYTKRGHVSMVDRTASLRWEEPGLPSTLIPQDSRSLLQSCKRPGSQACLLSTPPLLHFQSLGHFLGIRKTPCQIHSNFWLWVQGLALCQLQTRASLYLLELLTALGGSCHSIILFEFGRDSQSTPGCTGDQCLRRLLGSLRSAVLTLTQPLRLPPPHCQLIAMRN